MTGRPRPTHLNDKGEAHMVNIADKATTPRRAVAQSILRTRPEIAEAILGGALKKGDAVATARIAGIMAAKKTSDLIPLCHPLPISAITLDINPGATPGDITIHATVETVFGTGVEMEALTAATIAALTLYDMAKAMDREMTITQTCLLEKTGGRSGPYRRAGPVHP